jgi:hypothetical protein
MSEKKVPNSLLSSILLTSKRPEHVQKAYQKLAEKILLKKDYGFDDFRFVGEDADFSIFAGNNSPQFVFANLDKLLTALQEAVCRFSEPEQAEVFFTFLDRIENPNRKMPVLLHVLVHGKLPVLSCAALSRLRELPKLNPQNEHFLLEKSISDPLLCQELYPARLSFLDPERNYGEILKKIHLGNPEQDQIGVWIVINSGRSCPDEMIKYLSLRSEMCIEQTPKTDEVTIAAFENLCRKPCENFSTGLLQKFIKSRNLSPATDVKILNAVCSRVQDKALLEEYGRLSLLCGPETVQKTLEIFKQQGTNWPEVQISFYAEVIKRQPLKMLPEMACTYARFTLKSLSLRQKEELTASGAVLKLLDALSGLSFPREQRSADEIIDEIVRIPEILQAPVWLLLLEKWPRHAQIGINRSKSVQTLFSLLDMLIGFYPQNNACRDFIETKYDLIARAAKNILTLDSRQGSRLADILYRHGLAELPQLPGEIRKFVEEIKKEDESFREFMNDFA